MKNEINRLEMMIGKIMRVGVSIAIVLMVIGMGLTFIKTGDNLAQYREFTHLPAIWQGMLALQPAAWLMAGLLVLIFTPVLRVVTSIFVFAGVRDWTYVIITLCVLLILIIAIIFGFIKG